MPDQTPAVLSVESYAQGYAAAVARLRDNARYMAWLTSDNVTPDGPDRAWLADYLETVGPDGIDVSTGRWPAREQAVIRAAIAWRETVADLDDAAYAAWEALIEAVDELPHIGERPCVCGSDLPLTDDCPQHGARTGVSQASEPDDDLPPDVRRNLDQRPIDLGDRTPRPARSTKFQSAIAGRPLDLVSFTAGSGRQYEGERSDACPGDSVPGHRHYIGCIRPPSPPKPPAGRPQTFA